MPCYRCGVRQTDPEQGKPSPWRRAVRREHQVLICPGCVPDVLAEVDQCVGCGGTHLIRRLDQIECLDCRLARDVGPDRDLGLAGGVGPEAGSAVLPPGDPVPGDPAPGALAVEVASALDRVLRRR